MIREELFELSLPYYTGRNRKVRVYVPDREDDERLPVIYMTDGQNLFEDNLPGQLGCWHTREAVNEVGKAIIVGIHNDDNPLQRAKELTPKSIGSIRCPDDMPRHIRRMMACEGEAFDDFVVNTVMPEVENRFPVQTGRNAAAFCGSSSGGLQAFFTALSHADKFCMSGVCSPMFLWYSVRDIVGWTASRLSGSVPYLYIYSGAVGKLEKMICESTQAVYDGISEFYPAERLNEVILFDKPHHETAWSLIFGDFLHTFLTHREEL